MTTDDNEQRKAATACAQCDKTGVTPNREPVTWPNREDNSLSHFRTLAEQAFDDLLEVHRALHFDYPNPNLCQFCRERAEKERQENERT